MRSRSHELSAAFASGLSMSFGAVLLALAVGLIASRRAALGVAIAIVPAAATGTLFTLPPNVVALTLALGALAVVLDRDHRWIIAPALFAGVGFGATASADRVDVAIVTAPGAGVAWAFVILAGRVLRFAPCPYARHALGVLAVFALWL